MTTQTTSPADLAAQLALDIAHAVVAHERVHADQVAAFRAAEAAATRPLVSELLS